MILVVVVFPNMLSTSSQTNNTQITILLLATNCDNKRMLVYTTMCMHIHVCEFNNIFIARLCVQGQRITFENLFYFIYFLFWKMVPGTAEFVCVDLTIFF